jgi:hypothetical protein
MTNNINCKKCNRKFYTTKGADYCRPCKRELGLLTEVQKAKIYNQLLKDNCGDVNDFKEEIIMYSIRCKWDLLTELDYYKIAHMYLQIICDPVRFSQNPIKDQINYMLADLRTLLYGIPKKKRKPKTGRGIVEIIDGKINRSWHTISEAGRELDITSNMVGRICNGLSKRRWYNLMWEKDYRPN